MYINEIYNDVFKNDFNAQLPQIEKEIIEYIKKNPKSFNMDNRVDYLNEVLSRNENPNYTPDFLQETEDGLSVGMVTDELADFIVKNIPKDVQTLSIPTKVIDKHPELLKNYPLLTEVGINGSDYQFTSDEFKKFAEGTNVKIINAPYISLQDDENLPKFDYIYDRQNLNVKLDDLSLKCKFHGFDSIINLKTPITNEGLSIIPKDFFDKGCPFKIIQVNGKKILEKESRETKVLLSDNVLETKEFLSALLSYTDTKPEKISLVAQNKTYPNITELKPLESICNINIHYGELSDASIDQFDAMRGTLDYYKSLILQNDLSESERICYAYDLIKSNIYRESKVNKAESRDIHSIVETGNIVCVGYATFLAQLLKEVGIKAHAIGTSVPMKDGTTAGHERNLIEVKDEKYGINGIYAFDCTWDSNSDLYRVQNENGQYLTRNVKPGDEVVKQYDPMSKYTYFFIPASEYGLYFPGERQHENISEWYGNEFNPNEAALNELPDRLSKTGDTSDVYNTNQEVGEDVINEIIFNTRLYEGYSFEVNQELLEEVKEIRNLRAPKELRAEEGMTK